MPRASSTPKLPRPLTERQIAILGEFLRLANRRQSMALDELDGFFCALICSPDLVPFSEYFPAIFRYQSVQTPIFQSQEEAQEILGLLMRHWNYIAATLYAEKAYQPLIFDAPLRKQIPSPQAWAVGYLQGVSLRAAAWKPLFDHPDANLYLAPVLTLAGNDGPIPGTVKVKLDRDTRESMTTLLMMGLPLIYGFFRQPQEMHIPKATTKTASAKPKKAAKSAKPAPSAQPSPSEEAAPESPQLSFLIH